ncbi:NAD/NADP-dependent octopine/nopaline dehydrogenase family protein [Enemella evansiae]|uniref:Glycerol-3-phosphate dehydrogenase n=1 Tax=Enemella evansiae TaxID=2016499 RepID=A0A255GEM5_9ACTN|nr:NAD/NADP-dependent octopine/nopaline dehydrogenase family protein [Enemella evansiae]OYO01349.1 glycerol-3-phosphate dehydrogenase [Enemella evansiae]OYO14308.1 glycerol-3-phosphate dehydrogenase [Enemella evansiae]
MKIAVLGGGHGSYAAAADLAEQGHQVRLWRRDAEALAPLLADPVITLVDPAGERPVRLAGASVDLGAVVADAELILIPLPATAQPELARALAPLLRDGQVVYLPPGTFGSYLMAEEIHRAGSTAEVTFAETGTLPWLARKHGPTRVAVTVRATRLPTGVYPAHRADHALAVLREAFDSIEDAGDALSAALLNAGPIIHPPLILMNAAPLQHFAEWDIHNEGTQPAVRAVTNRLDAERIAIRSALGSPGEHFPLADHYENDRWMYGDAHRKLVDSGDWREHIDLSAHRYMTEDTLLGLGFLTSVAEYAGVDVPIATGLLQMARAITGTTEAPRSLAGLGLATMSRTELANLLAEGRP